jgi:hypothetical protein
MQYAISLHPLHFFGNHSAKVRFSVLTASFSRALDCQPHRLVLADPFNGCDDVHDPTLYDDAIVLVARGDCSFFHKAHSMISGGAAAVVVVNSDSELFEMAAENGETSGHDGQDLSSNGALGAPVVMLGLSDANQVLALIKQASGNFGALQASVDSDGGCVAPRTQQEKHVSRMSEAQRKEHQIEAAEALAIQSPAGVMCFEPSCETAVALIAAVASGSAPVNEWSAHVRGNLTAEACTCTSTFDYLSARFSGPLALIPDAFQRALAFNSTAQVERGGGVLSLPVSVVHWDELCVVPESRSQSVPQYTLVVEARHPRHRLKEFRRKLCDAHTVALHAQQSGSLGVLFASPGHAIWHLEALERPGLDSWETSQQGHFYASSSSLRGLQHGPSPVRIPVVMVSKSAAAVIAASGVEMLMLDHERNALRWHELGRLAHSKRWPMGRTNRERLRRRLDRVSDWVNVWMDECSDELGR